MQSVSATVSLIAEDMYSHISNRVQLFGLMESTSKFTVIASDESERGNYRENNVKHQVLSLMKVLSEIDNYRVE